MRLSLLILIFTIYGCHRSISEKKSQRTSESVKWIDSDTLEISSTGEIPYPPRDSTTNKLLSCQNARSAAIEKFHKDYMKDDSREDYYNGRKYSRRFHRYKMEIVTYKKENDEKGNCRMTIHFKGENLRLKLQQQGSHED